MSISVNFTRRAAAAFATARRHGHHKQQDQNGEASAQDHQSLG
jgi:hypothetical protein